MKLRVKQDIAYLTLSKTDQDTVTLEYPVESIFQWYPFNINYAYRYSCAKHYMYLVEEENCTGEPRYKVDILKRTKKLKNHNGAPFNQPVLERNLYIMDRAESLGLATLKTPYSLADVKDGFALVKIMIQTVKNNAEDRLLREKEGKEITYTMITPELLDGNWDSQIYDSMTDSEREVLDEFAEMYGMLTVMRKIAEGR